MKCHKVSLHIMTHVARSLQQLPPISDPLWPVFWATETHHLVSKSLTKYFEVRGAVVLKMSLCDNL